MATMRQIASNRTNAGKSTGPKTVEGKAESRRNALTHGLTAEVVCSESDDEAVKTRLTEWWSVLAPQNRMQGYFAKQAVVASLRVETCQAKETTRLNLLARVATEPGTRWDLDRHGEALAHSELIRRNPPRGWVELRKTPAGRAWLITQWNELMAVLAVAGGSVWGPCETSNAMDLLGIPKKYREFKMSVHIKFSTPEKTRELIAVELQTLAAEDATAAQENTELRNLHAKGMALEDDKTLKTLHRYESTSHRMLSEALLAIDVFRSIEIESESDAPVSEVETRRDQPRKVEPKAAPIPIPEPFDDEDLEAAVRLALAPIIMPPAPVPEAQPHGNRRERRQQIVQTRRESARAESLAFLEVAVSK